MPALYPAGAESRLVEMALKLSKMVYNPFLAPKIRLKKIWARAETRDSNPWLEVLRVFPYPSDALNLTAANADRAMRRSRARTCGHTHLHDYMRCPSICRGAYLRWNRGDDKPLPSPVRTTRRHCPVRLHCTNIPCSTGCNVQVVLRAFRGRVVRLCSESRACHTDPRWRTSRLHCVH